VGRQHVKISTTKEGEDAGRENHSILLPASNGDYRHTQSTDQTVKRCGPTRIRTRCKVDIGMSPSQTSGQRTAASGPNTCFVGRHQIAPVSSILSLNLYYTYILSKVTLNPYYCGASQSVPAKLIL